MAPILAFARTISNGLARQRLPIVRLAGARDLVEAPLLIDAILVGGWALARLFEKPQALVAMVVVGSVIALRWPASGAGLASLAFIFPLQPGGLESGAPLLVAAGIGCFVVAARADAQLRLNPAVVFAAGLVATTGLALLRLLNGPLSELGIEASLHWAGLVLGLTTLPVHLFLISRGSRRALAILTGATIVAIGIGCVDGLWPRALDSTTLGSLLSNVPSDRATGSFPSPNRLGTVAAIAAVGAGVLAWECRGWQRLAFALGATVATVTVLASFSRGALLGLLIAVIVLVARRSLSLAAAVALVGALAIFGVEPNFMEARLGSPSATSQLPAQQAENDAGRMDAWRAGLRMGAAQPITGHGYGAFAALGDDYGGPGNLRTAHNETIALFAEVGLPGVVSFVGLIGASLWALRRRSVAHDLGLAALLVFVTASSFNIQSVYPQVTTLVWAMVALGLAPGTLASTAEGTGWNEHDEGNVGDADGRALISE